MIVHCALKHDRSVRKRNRKTHKYSSVTFIP